jgi:malonyl-CoA decarboxylase
MLDVIRSLRRDGAERDDVWRIAQACKQLLSERGESNSRALAAAVIEHWRRLDADGVHRFFKALAADFDPDPGEVLRLAENYAVTRSPDNLVKLARAAEPPRQELLRRLNRAEGGTKSIVQMRSRLLDRLRQDRSLKAVDADFQHLLSSWFNPGFLRLVQVDWSSPAALLERIIHHEAVHEIDGWNDLRRRLEPDRRCFAFFHPVLPDEPLIFVEIALLPAMPGAIAPLLDRSVPAAADPRAFKVAVFYSISNCQPGLRGINLGNFLIKQVAERLQAEFPKLRTFCTLSPIPGFAAWLTRVDAESLRAPRMRAANRRALQEALAGLRSRHGTDLSGLLPQPGTAAPPAPADDAADRAALSALCAHYLLHRTATDAPEADPVGRFHLNNGARLQRINPAGDLSRKGLRQSFGMMVNYLYDLDEVETNHEKFMHGEVAAARAVISLM